METKLFKIESVNNTDKINAVSKILSDGGLVAIPTETVYGLAANALDPKAVRSIFEAKGRPQDNPLIVHISELSQLYPLVKSVSETALKLANEFWPGPLTMIFDKSDIIPEEVSCGLKTVAVRMPSHPIARAIISQSKLPLAAPSANTSGKPSPTKAEHVMHDMNGKIDAVVDGGMCEVGVESTVISLLDNGAKILRPGGITKEMLESVVENVEVDDAVFAELKKGEKPSSPGMKYKHYSPSSDVFIVKGSLDDFVRYVSDFNGESVAAVCFDGEESKIPIPCKTFGRKECPEEQANALFDVLREYDDGNIQRIYVRCPDENGIGMAVMNRLLRAAAFRVIEL